MKRIIGAALIAALTLPAAGWADNGKAKGKDKGQAGVVVQQGAKGPSRSNTCPPGLAKKAVPCVPPGQVKSQYRVGDRIDQDYWPINDPYRYGLRPGGSYVRAGDYVYQIDRDTQKVLNLIGAVADILN